MHVLLERQFRLTMRALVIVRSGAFCEGWSWGALEGCEGGCDDRVRGTIFTGDM